uniref:chitinase n=1 Tax=Coturnix japonica TaxID=93934 RepID=A0A8C2UBK7_COTJA
MLAAFEQEARLSNIQADFSSTLPGGGYLDYFHVMTYDFHGSWDGQTGENSPLYSGNNAYLSVDYAMNYWKSNGAPAEKLLVGFPTYGHSFILKDPHSITLRALGHPKHPPLGPAGPLTNWSWRVSGCTLSSYFQAWDAPQDVPYAYKSTEWVGYDNIKSFNIKTDWLKKNNYGGAMVWSLDMDDFTGTFCKQGKYPLITTLKNALGQQSSSCVPPAQPNPPITAAPSTGSGSGSGSSGSNTGSSGGSGFCAGKANGIYADPTNKSKFYNCNNGETFTQTCQAGLVFDSSCSCCNWA